jgi:hypothetical protein
MVPILALFHRAIAIEGVAIDWALYENPARIGVIHGWARPKEVSHIAGLKAAEIGRWSL